MKLETAVHLASDIEAVGLPHPVVDVRLDMQATGTTTGRYYVTALWKNADGLWDGFSASSRAQVRRYLLKRGFALRGLLTVTVEERSTYNLDHATTYN